MNNICNKNSPPQLSELHRVEAYGVFYLYLFCHLSNSASELNN